MISISILVSPGANLLSLQIQATFLKLGIYLLDLTSVLENLNTGLIFLGFSYDLLRNPEIQSARSVRGCGNLTSGCRF